MAITRVYSMLSITNVFRLLIISLFFTANIVIAEDKPTVNLQKDFDQLKEYFEKSIKNASLFEQNLGVIDDKQKEFASLNIKLEECIANNNEKLTAFKNNLTVLGDKETSEDRDIKTQRKELEEQVQKIDNELKQGSRQARQVM